MSAMTPDAQGEARYYVASPKAQPFYIFAASCSSAYFFTASCFTRTCFKGSFSARFDYANLKMHNLSKSSQILCILFGGFFSLVDFSLWWIFLFGGFFSLVDFSLWWIKIQDGGSISQRVVRRFVQVAIQYTYSCIYVYRDNMYYTHKEPDKISRINFTERHFESCASGLR